MVKIKLLTGIVPLLFIVLFIHEDFRFWNYSLSMIIFDHGYPGYDPFSKNTKAGNTANFFCKNKKDKIMFLKNLKVAGTTLFGVLLQIAVHYHKYEVPLNLQSIKENNFTNYGFLLNHTGLDFLEDFRKLFPKREYLWLSSVRNPENQIVSWIQYTKRMNLYSQKNFEKTLETTKSRSLEGFTHGDGHMSYFILRSCAKFGRAGYKFEKCAREVIEEFDLIIPVERFNEGLVALHKMTCLPLSDFAYVKRLHHSEKFQLSTENISAILKFHEDDIFYHEYASKKFDAFFEEFQKKYCHSVNCSQEVELLLIENKKLEHDCGFRVSNFVGKRQTYTLDFGKMKHDFNLALKCLPFAIERKNLHLINRYNEIIRQNGSSDFAKTFVPLWLETIKENTSVF